VGSPSSVFIVPSPGKVFFTHGPLLWQPPESLSGFNLSLLQTNIRAARLLFSSLLTCHPLLRHLPAAPSQPGFSLLYTPVSPPGSWDSVLQQD
jgi:hypothetical protein